ncbi:hypothetical protein [Hymenobacter properus]|uniref:Uncharacterized protein n=1 Tax=Hymenobacter properus TaxID=2791026 RepID=A0A931BNX6_9BACT|nr:hypothetical protein [Hymenobacter properus]MBF9143748.1 hypothetical protein [Hymenobacter properus]MBR7722561.1 hypothetical protein [Microvirga sp. SRT04]
MPDSLDSLPPEIRAQIEEIGEAVHSDSELDEKKISGYERVTKAKDQSFKLQTLVGAWQRQNKAERKLRQKVAWCILVALGIQIILVNTTFFLIGFGVIKAEENLAKIFILAVFAEIVAMVLIVLRYLFPRTGNEFLQLIKEL